jgi:hypothetical protein
MAGWIYNLAERCEIIEKKAKTKNNILVTLSTKNTDPLNEVQHTEVIFTISCFFLSFCEVIHDRERACITILSTPIFLHWKHYKFKSIIIEIDNLFMHMNAIGKYIKSVACIVKDSNCPHFYFVNLGNWK